MPLLPATRRALLPILLVLVAAAPAFADEAPDPCAGAVEGRTVTAIAYAGLEQTREFVVRRELEHRAGSPFSCDAWDRERRRLESLDIFASVSLETAPHPGGVALTYRFLELPGFVVFPAVKRSDVYGWLVGPGVAVMNLFGRDIRVEAFLRTLLYPDPFAATEFLVRANSMWLWDLPIEYDVGFARGDAFNDVKGFDESYWDGNLDLYHRVGSKVRLGYHAQVFYQAPDPAHPTFDVPGNPAPVPVLVGASGGDFVPGLGVGVSWDSRSSRYNPYRGVYQEVRMSRFGSFLGGDADYSQLLVDHRSFWSVELLRGMPTILHLSALGRYRPGRMGAYDYFIVGGPNTLRSVEPVRTLYAQHELLATAELRQELFARRALSILGLNVFYGLQLVAGADGALLWRGQDALAHPRSHGALYAGVHLLVPALDRIRLEAGMHPTASGWQFGFSLGLYEKSYEQRQRLR